MQCHLSAAIIVALSVGVACASSGERASRSVSASIARNSRALGQLKMMLRGVKQAFDAGDSERATSLLASLDEAIMGASIGVISHPDYRRIALGADEIRQRLIDRERATARAAPEPPESDEDGRELPELPYLPPPPDVLVNVSQPDAPERAPDERSQRWQEVVSRVQVLAEAGQHFLERADDASGPADLTVAASFALMRFRSCQLDLAALLTSPGHNGDGWRVAEDEFASAQQQILACRDGATKAAALLRE